MKNTLFFVFAFVFLRKVWAFAPASSSSLVIPGAPFAKQSSFPRDNYLTCYAISLGRSQQGSTDERKSKREERFARTSSKQAQAQAPCILKIDGVSYNMTAWAKAHPGGEKVLLRFHDKDASKAFHAAGHSKHAYEMLKELLLPIQHRLCHPLQEAVPFWTITSRGGARNSSQKKIILVFTNIWEHLCFFIFFSGLGRCILVIHHVVLGLASERDQAFFQPFALFHTPF